MFGVMAFSRLFFLLMKLCILLPRMVKASWSEGRGAMVFVSFEPSFTFVIVFSCVKETCNTHLIRKVRIKISFYFDHFATSLPFALIFVYKDLFKLYSSVQNSRATLYMWHMQILNKCFVRVFV